ncbi:dTDP-4-dehydrorhamnose reductase [Pusillimonas sp. T7-7]|uniref:dTDP-4-dehydrorhamnose reductase n=1 Tax=Pusillimonas sp. (strain T7-7) TaxID=1007105 RepID=UPI0002084BA1|nr:dTDP-4-dehydrorhamnose reductase [Pusillimonas sp. T7-7]AEC21694.1 dTDP-4-dehydrorhamnose reductase [Pusillimonas sp. T7-7]
MKVLLTGADGQLGRCLQDRCPAHWRLLALNRSRLDITDSQAVSRRVALEQPDWIINAAAYTAVDQAEGDAEQAFSVNVKGAAHLAEAAGRAGARLLHVSTDYVFDGQLRRPYTEQDAARPLNEYGRSKLLGERAVLQSLSQALVLRTSGVYSEYGNNFVKTMLRLAAAAGKEVAPTKPENAAGQPSNAAVLRIVADQHICPTYAGDLADAVIDLMACSPPASGLYHYCGAMQLSWHEFAQHIFDCAQRQDASFSMPPLQAISASDYSAPAQRPAYSVLACEKIKGLGIWPKPLFVSLSPVIKALLAK